MIDKLTLEEMLAKRPGVIQFREAYTFFRRWYVTELRSEFGVGVSSKVRTILARDQGRIMTALASRRDKKALGILVGTIGNIKIGLYNHCVEVLGMTMEEAHKNLNKEKEGLFWVLKNYLLFPTVEYFGLRDEIQTMTEMEIEEPRVSIEDISEGYLPSR